MNTSLINRRPLGILLAILSAVVFGLWPATTRAVYAGGGNPVFMMVATTLARALGLSLYCLASKKALFRTRHDTKQAITGGFFQAVSIIGVFASLMYLPGPVMIIILFTHTLMLLFFMAWRKEIALDAVTLLSTVAALCGLSLVLDIWRPKQLSLLGLGLALIAAVATMSRLYVYGQQTKTRNPSVVGAEAFLITALFTLVIPLFSPPHLPASPAGLLWALLGCASMTAGTFFVFYGIAAIGSFEFSLLCKLEPVFTSLFAATLIREYLSWHQYLGIIIVLGSLAGYQYYQHKAGRRHRAAAVMIGAPDV